MKDGRPFTFELLTNQGNDERKKVAEIIQASLREMGVGVEIRIIEWAAFLKEYIKKRRFDAIVLGWGIGHDPDQYVVWHSSQTDPDQLNHIAYANPEVDRLLEEGRASCVQADRVQVTITASRRSWPRTSPSSSSTSVTRCPSCPRACAASIQAPAGIRTTSPIGSSPTVPALHRRVMLP